MTNQITLTPKEQIILDVVTDFWHTTIEVLRGPRRHKSIVVPRHVAMYLLRKHTNRTVNDIGIILERDHSVISHADRAITMAVHGRNARRWYADIITQLSVVEERIAMMLVVEPTEVETELENMLCHA